MEVSLVIIYEWATGEHDTDAVIQSKCWFADKPHSEGALLFNVCVPVYAFMLSKSAVNVFKCSNS